MAGEKVKTLQCPSCAGTVLVHMPGQSVTVVCSSCSSVLDASSEGAAIIQKYSEKARIKPEIPFGVKGELLGNKWMCLGMIVKKETKWGFTWKEYLLFNPQGGFRWLTESDGHWGITTTLPKKPQDVFDSAMFFYGHSCLQHQGRNFRLFHRGVAEVEYCLGEFYWRVQKGEKIHFADYVRPGEGITVETEAAEQVCSYSLYLEPEIVQKAFGLDIISKPYKISPMQPGGYEYQWPTIRNLWVSFVGALFFLFFVFSASKDSKYIATSSGFQNAISTPVTQKLADFELDSTQNLEFELKAPVQNAWLELNYTLINKKTGDSIDFDQGVEYYFGRDSDGAWSEGSQQNQKILSAMPPGTYELVAMGPHGVPFEVSVKRDVPMYSNILCFLFILSLLPIIFLIMMYSDLANRWEESDYSPFAGSEE